MEDGTEAEVDDELIWPAIYTRVSVQFIILDDAVAILCHTHTLVGSSDCRRIIWSTMACVCASSLLLITFAKTN